MLTQLAEQLWCAEQAQTLPGGVQIPTRMTVLGLSDGRLVLHSPIAMDDALAEEVTRLGTVTDIVAPNCLHHLYLAGAAARFPRAQVHGPPGLREKRPDISFHSVLSDRPPATWGEEIDLLLLAGQPRINELAFLHRRSRTLIVSDFVFHMLRPQGFATGLLLRMFGTHRRLARSRLWHLYTRDRRAARRSERALLEWQFERLVMAHGEPVLGEAHQALSQLLS
jgi:hypothetical protein